MSLDNVFMGKKVVQQIYLKNALIYQAKGWETLPSSPQVLWNKSYGSQQNTFKDCAVDQDNNIYIAFPDWIYKISSEGILIWKNQMSGLEKICVDQNNNIYLSQITYFEQNDNDKSVIISQLDTNGTVINKIKVHSYFSNIVTGFTFDKDYLYVSSKASPSANIVLFGVDKRLKNSVNLHFSGKEMDNMATSLDSPYIYYGLDALYKIKKQKTDVSLPIKIKDMYPINNIVIDNLGNVIFSNENDTYKYNISSQQVTAIPIVSNAVHKSICLDYQQNLYSLNLQLNNNPFTANLVKLSSDGTLIYNTQVISNDSDSGLNNGMLIADNNGNIYFAYKNKNNDFLFTKIINLVKKGN